MRSECMFECMRFVQETYNDHLEVRADSPWEPFECPHTELEKEHSTTPVLLQRHHNRAEKVRQQRELAAVPLKGFKFPGLVDLVSSL